MFCVLLGIVICLAVVVLVDRYFHDEGFENIPGPKGFYIIGNALDFIMNDVKLFYFFRYLSNKYKDLYKGSAASKKFVIIINPEDVEAVISGSKNISKGFLYRLLKPWLNEGLLLSTGDKWRNRRRLLTPAFHFNVLLNYKTIFEEHSMKLVEQLGSEINKPKTDIYTLLSACTLNVICETAMGTKLDPHDKLNKQYQAAIHNMGKTVAYRGSRAWLFPETIFAMSSTGREQKHALNVIKSFRNKIINKRRDNVPCLTLNENLENDEWTMYKKNRMAMLDLLLKAEKEGAIDDDGIKEEVDTFMFEGHDTTATCLQFTFMLLASNPAVQEKVFEECSKVFGTADRGATMEDLNQLKYLECCIKEQSLRLYPPVYYVIRTLDQDVQIRSYRVPSGADCVIIMYDLHRRQDQFIEPLEFRPERFSTEPTWHPYAYIPFSAGPRNCIGQKFAMIEMKILLAAVLRRYRILPITKPLDLQFYVDFILRIKNPIYVKIEKRE